MIILRLFQSSFLTFKAVSSRSCFLGVRFRVEVTSVFDYDIIFGGKRERVLQIEVAFFEFVFFGKIMFRFTYLWWGC